MAYKPKILELAAGGTNASLTASNGGIFYSTASSGAILSGTATAGQHLQSGASGAPSWTTATFPGTAGAAGTILRSDGTNWLASTSTYPNTNAINTLIYASSANVMSALTAGNQSVLTSSTTGVPSWTSIATDGQVIIGSTAGNPAAATLTAGAGVTITNASNSITINSVSFTSTGATTMVINNGYRATGAGTYTLPSTSTSGSRVTIFADVAGVIVQAPAAITIQIGALTSSAAGSLTSTLSGDSVTLIYFNSVTKWCAISYNGSWTVA